jgi:hypothetical protein
MAFGGRLVAPLARAQLAMPRPIKRRSHSVAQSHSPASATADQLRRSVTPSVARHFGAHPHHRNCRQEPGSIRVLTATKPSPEEAPKPSQSSISNRRLFPLAQPPTTLDAPSTGPLDAGHQTPGTRHQAPDAGHRAPGTGHRAPSRSAPCIWAGAELLYRRAIFLRVVCLQSHPGMLDSTSRPMHPRPRPAPPAPGPGSVPIPGSIPIPIPVSVRVSVRPRSLVPVRDSPPPKASASPALTSCGPSSPIPAYSRAFPSEHRPSIPVVSHRRALGGSPRSWTLICI